MPNRLANEASPYLLQHKDNPVDWYPWGQGAFERARREDRPILLSIGYSACHWCHVMERESFEDEGTAALMNREFVNIKVDREERPDVDHVYMQAVQAMTGRGGWPLTVFLLPDGTPFYGGTYFPPDDRHGMPGFPRLLAAVAEAYRTRRQELADGGRRLLQQIDAGILRPDPAAVLTDELLHNAAADARARFDSRFAGFGGAPKFPNPMELDLLLRYQHRFGDRQALQMALATLGAMARGGIYDQVGGGFHRYSTDAEWLVPHFEKMLYDNAQLAATYLDAFLVTRDPFYARVARETLDYVLQEMHHPEGGFFSTQDADSEGEEGKFYLWTADEIDAVAGEDGPLLREYFGVRREGNFEGRNILHVPVAHEEFARAKGLPPERLRTVVDEARRRLYAAREERIHPGRDEKVLAAWNGLMVQALARAARVFDDGGRYLEAARPAVDFLLRELRPGGRLLRSWKDGRPGPTGYLEDHAALVLALADLYETTFEPAYLRTARELAAEMLRLFWDAGEATFYDTGADHERLVTRPRNIFDNATPAGGSLAVDGLLRLAVLTGEPELERTATAALRALAPFVQRVPSAFGRLLCALDFHLGRTIELAVVWPAGTDPRPLLDTAFRAYRPNLVAAGEQLDGRPPLAIPLLEHREAVDGKPTAYVCEHYACRMPVTEPEELAAQLG